MMPLNTLSRWAVAALAVALAGSGCATSPVAAAKKANVQRVKVDSQVQTEEPFQYGYHLEGYNLTAALTKATMKGIYRDNTKTATELMRQHQVSVPDEVRKAFIEEVKASGVFTPVESGEDGIFMLTLRQHGFDHHTFSAERRIPFMVLQGELLDRNHKRIWRSETGLVDDGGRDVGTSWEQYRTDPDKLKRDWQIQAKAAAQKLFRAR